jgi:hypothetical protein
MDGWMDGWMYVDLLLISTNVSTVADYLFAFLVNVDEEEDIQYCTKNGWLHVMSWREN